MNNIKQDFTIRDLQNISGIKAHTIRIWEKRYNLLQPKRTDTNIRSYSNQNLTKLLNISLLNKNSFKISKIAEMSEAEIIQNARALAFEVAINDEAINSLKLAMFQFDKILFNETYNKLLHKITFRDVFKEVFIPFFRTSRIALANRNVTSCTRAFYLQFDCAKNTNKYREVTVNLFRF